LPEHRNEGVLQTPARSQNFSTFALFSPDGQLILTAGATEGRLQLWRAPSAASRGYEIRQLVSAEKAVPTCGAFAPDGKFLVTGTRTGLVYVWPMPAREEIDKELTAKVTLIERALDSSARQVRVWAEMPNPGERLLPGSTVTMAIYPGK
jgi:WD40 repeat protein